MKFIIVNKDNKPIIHFITNYVTSNDLANITSILGGSPIMADEKNEMEDITKFVNCLVINIGTINVEQFNSIKIACDISNKRKTPIILDPVGAACSKFRQDVVEYILTNFHIAVIKGNITEINYLVYGLNANTGIDADKKQTQINFDDMKEFCKKHNSIMVITGKYDYVIDHFQVTTLMNGCELATKLIGTGCMLGAALAVYVSLVKPKDYYDSVILAISIFNIAMEIANDKIPSNYLGDFKTQLWNVLGNIDEQTIQKYIKTK